MTDPLWPPPVCPACAFDFHDHCVWVTGCECENAGCLPLPDEESE